MDCNSLQYRHITTTLALALGPLLVRAPGKYPHLPPPSQWACLWQVKDKHGSYLILGSGMTRPESQTRVVNVRALQGVRSKE